MAGSLSQLRELGLFSFSFSGIVNLNSFCIRKYTLFARFFTVQSCFSRENLAKSESGDMALLNETWRQKLEREGRLYEQE